MKKKIIGLIPVRLKSSRLKQKSLLMIKKIPLIIHTYRRAKLSKKLDDDSDSPILTANNVFSSL